MREIVSGIIGTLSFASSVILAFWVMLSDVAPGWVRIVAAVYILVMLFAFGFTLGGGGEE